ncbi:MAG TPA: hypothetical protein VM537_26305 [Anaerolineae bacterium]|nr:hypothetical protein [Anaerolineae bacterium]
MHENASGPDKESTVVRLTLVGLGLCLVTASLLDFVMNLAGSLGQLVIGDADRLAAALNRLLPFRLLPLAVGVALVMGSALWFKIPACVFRTKSVVRAIWDRHGLVLVLVLYASLTIATLVLTPLGFDEAYNLTVPRNLALHGFYGSTVRGTQIPFDPFISTGPAVLGPIGLLFYLLGDSILVARLVMVAHHLLLVILVLFLVDRWIGRRAIPLAVLVLMGIPGHLFQASSVLGELPAVMWFLGGVVTANQALRAGSSLQPQGRIAVVGSGVMWGLAVLSKPTFVVMLGSSLAIVIYLRMRHDLDAGELRWWLSIIGIAGILTVGWFVVSAILRGPANYALDVVAASGAGLSLVDPHLFQNFSRNLPLLAGRLDLAVLIGAITFFWASKRHEPSPVAQRIVLGAAACWAVWWILFNGRGWIRHAYPALVLLTIPITHFASELIRELRVNTEYQPQVAGGRTRSVGRTAVWAIGMALFMMLVAQQTANITSLSRARDIKRQQDQLVEYLNQEAPDASLTGLGWLLAWDVSYRLPDRPVLDLLQLEAAKARDAVLIVTPAGPDLKEVPADYQLEPIVDFGEYELYRVRLVTEQLK